MSQFDTAWMKQYQDIVNADQAVKVLGRVSDVNFMMELGERSYTLRFVAGQLESVTPSEELLFDANWSFAIRGPEESWAKNVLTIPPPEFTDVIFMAFNNHVVLEGNLLPFWQNVRVLMWMFDLMRKVS